MRPCPHPVFREASNGLSLFLSEYPHMSDTQKKQIKEIVELHSRPETYRGIIRRQALKCSVGPDGVISIAPQFAK